MNFWNYVDSHDPTLGNSFLGATELVKKKKNADIDKCKYSGYGNGFYTKGTSSFSTGGSGTNVIIFRADISSSEHVDNKKKYILILGEGPIQGLDDTTFV